MKSGDMLLKHIMMPAAAQNATSYSASVSVIHISLHTHCNHNQNEGNGSQHYSPANEIHIPFEPCRAGTTLVVATKVETTKP
jgi:hypothetical protein